MSRQYTLKEFITMTIPQKERLYKRDKEQYLKLKNASDTQYSIETDHEVLSQVNTKARTKSKL